MKSILVQSLPSCIMLTNPMLIKEAAESRMLFNNKMSWFKSMILSVHGSNLLWFDICIFVACLTSYLSIYSSFPPRLYKFDTMPKITIE